MPTLVVQLGHCYRSSGATGTSGEQAFATAVANACVKHLHGRGGWSVRKILADDAPSLYRGDAFAAIHGDGSDNRSARGASVGYQGADGQRVAQAWKRAYTARGWTGPWRLDNYTSSLAGYYGVREALEQGNERAFIIEGGFLTNAEDRALMTGPGGPDRVAYAIGDALGIPHGGNVTSPAPDTDLVKDAAWRVLALAEGHEKQQGGPSAGQSLEMITHLLAVVGRIEALTHLRDRVAWGPTGPEGTQQGELVELVAALKTIRDNVDDLGDVPEAVNKVLTALSQMDTAMTATLNDILTGVTDAHTKLDEILSRLPEGDGTA